MWARSASTYVRTQGLRLGASCTCGRLESVVIHVQYELEDAKPVESVPDTRSRSKKFYLAVEDLPLFSLGSHFFSSLAGARSGEEEDGSDCVSDSEVHDEDGAENCPESKLQLDVEHGGGRSLPERKRDHLNLTRTLLNEPKSIHTALDKYVSEGNSLDRLVKSRAMLALRGRLMYRKALQFSEWQEAKKVHDLTEQHYASRVDLIAKVHGLQKAERHIKLIPESLRGELVYRTLLANCVSLNNLKKAEEVYNKMKQSNFGTSAFTCNQMIILYKKIDKKKIADVLLYMEKENVKPTSVTYRLLIDTKGQSSDIAGMEQIVETMKADGLEPDLNTKAIMAKHYIAAGLHEKAESVLKEMEGVNLSYTRSSCSVLISLYATLGKEDQVERIWKICEVNTREKEYTAAIIAWGKLKQIEKAEAVFKKYGKTKKLTSRDYSTMLRVYADNKMLNKGKELVKRMGERGCQFGPLIWDSLVKLYVEAGEVEKADAILHKAVMQQNNHLIKPMLNSYMIIMEEYAKRGDVHNSEKIFCRLKEAGYAGRLGPFQILLQAYMKSKTHPYGLRERMMTENIFPNRSMASMLSQADPFKTTPVSDLLD